MRILVDEDTAVQVVQPLRHVLFGHQVDHVSDISWKGKKDRQVLSDASRAGYGAYRTEGALRHDRSAKNSTVELLAALSRLPP